MKKDVIYIDVDDDVTAIIGKVKEAKEKVVALVPPKRAGALQSAVNLRLLARMAKTDNKHLVLVTANSALVALAASAQIPVARNLQSKPEMPEPSDEFDEEEEQIIDGAALAVGAHAGLDKKSSSGSSKKSENVEDAPAAPVDRNEVIDDIDVEVDGKMEEAKAKKRTSSKATKIPNFGSFRTKLFAGIAGGIGLAALLVWMFVFAPAATVIVTARKNDLPVSTQLNLTTPESTSYEDNRIRVVTQTSSVDETVEFEATGEENVGDKATGTVTFSTDSIAIALAGTTISAGTQLTSGSGYVFVTDEAVTLTIDNYSGASTTVTASGRGTSYNGASGSMYGAPSGINASLDGATSGGTDQTVKIVTQDDVDRAVGQLVGRSTEEQEAALAELFEGDIVISGSFTSEQEDPESTPAVGDPVDGSTAQLIAPTVYTVYAIPQAELEIYLRGYVEAQIDTASQKIYDTGAETATAGNFTSSDDGMTATISTAASIGPVIDEATIKDQSKGKIFGEVKSTLTAQNGISTVDVQFSHWWVRTVPNNTDKIEVVFEVEENE